MVHRSRLLFVTAFLATALALPEDSWAQPGS